MTSVATEPRAPATRAAGPARTPSSPFGSVRGAPDDTAFAAAAAG